MIKYLIAVKACGIQLKSPPVSTLQNRILIRIHSHTYLPFTNQLMTFQSRTKLGCCFKYFKLILCLRITPIKLLKPLATVCRFISSECRYTDCWWLNKLCFLKNALSSSHAYKHVVSTYVIGYMASYYGQHIILFNHCLNV